MPTKTNEYQFDVKETEDGYDVEIFILHNKSLHKKDETSGFNTLEEVFQYIRNYQLGPSCYIQGVFLERIKTSSTTLNTEERNFVQDLAKWNKIRKVEVLVTG